MDNIILKSLSVENFASFAELSEFTTETDSSKKEYLDNTFINGDIRFNKVSFLYGANGSGKTFFCKILREIQRLLTLSPLLAAPNSSQFLSTPQVKGLDVPVKPFVFDIHYREKPTTFKIDIVMSAITYHYEFSVQGKTVVRELLTKKYRRTEKLIERTSPLFKDIILRSELKGFESAKQTVKPEALCLPVAAMLNNSLADQLNTAICGIQVVSMAAGRLNPLNPKKTFTKERIDKYIRIIQKADPTIRNINVSSSEEEIARQKIDVDDFENREIIATKTTVSVDTKHVVYNNGVEQEEQAPITFFAEESLGTIKLFTALPYLYDVLESGGVLIIDELENGLHLSLAKEIINLFNSESSNPKHAQLICTSHQPLLLDGNYRRDQVWVSIKDSFGQCSLHRLSGLQTPRAKVNLTTQILKGAFGCNPKLFFDNNT
ncbi:AAA family ATPase [Harryflintia acetispora]|uniref:AAA15 family ATPase/GTPase n=1 Tax=Harryflintia acetispora TaxID=1849041 RepID=A0A9X8Y7M8_9FIRM|nr:ATP-binding protein [Harryflintia acetispora]TCL42540.1 AAA15 family ATPase/GTPase [Harryflintia acetispora]